MNGTRIRYAVLTLLFASLTGFSPATLAEEHTRELPSFIKGYSWGWVGSRGEYASDEAATSMQKLAVTGTEWVCIAFSTNLKTADDPDFTWGNEYPRMVSDEEVRHAIALARQNGLKVILKPVVNVGDGTWRAWIKFFRPVTYAERTQGIHGVADPWGSKTVQREGETVDLTKWARFWKNFDGFVTHYAAIAEQEEVELFCVGCEMNSTEQFELQWRELIARVREVYHGPITYDSNHGRESELTWWDAVDVIGISAYYAVPAPAGKSMEEAIKITTSKQAIVAELQQVKSELSKLHELWKKPILFIETGVTSVRGCARYPWTHPNSKPESPLDEQEQSNYYQAMFEVFWDEPWLLGFAWWDWPAQLYDREDASENRGFCVYGKQAESVLREWYAKPVQR